MVPRPVALGLTLCDYVIVEERTRKVSLIGIFSGMRATRFPALVQPFSAFATLTDALGDGEGVLNIVHMDTDQHLYAFRSALHFPDRFADVRFHLRLGPLVFPARDFINSPCWWTASGSPKIKSDFVPERMKK